MSHTNINLTALVMAGGRIGGGDAQAIGTGIKALALIESAALLDRVLAALCGVEAVKSIVVVGPPEVKACLKDRARWQAETTSLLGNVQAGVQAAGLSGEDRVLLFGSDLAFPCAASIVDFIERSPSNISVTTPLVTRDDYLAAYPQSPSVFLRLREGEFTMGSQFLSPAGLLLHPTPAIAAMLGHRKSQLKMALTFGPRFVAGLLTRSLTIEGLERRASQLLGVPSAAVPDCAPDLAFDIDDARDYAYAIEQSRH